MSSRSLIVWRFCDGKRGHENQSLALVESLQQEASCEVVDVPLTVSKETRGSHREAAPPDLALGAGHRTHLALLRASTSHDCPSVVIMNPTIPRALFDLCLIPQHDLPASDAPNVVITRGMLSRIPVDIPPKPARGLILAGGPSKHHGWEAGPLVEAITEIVKANSGLAWSLTDSRRTPDGFLDELQDLDLEIHSSTETPPQWLPEQLVSARDVWVTEDSMSMIYEALTAQARVGLLPLPRKTTRSRVVRGIDRLVQEGWTRFFEAGLSAGPPPAPETLHEASRCAREVLKRFFPSLA